MSVFESVAFSSGVSTATVLAFLPLIGALTCLSRVHFDRTDTREDVVPAETTGKGSGAG